MLVGSFYFAERSYKDMARMRSIPKAVEEIRKKDPETCVSESVLRRWVKSGTIPSVKTGKNFLVNLDALEAYMECAYADR